MTEGFVSKTVFSNCPGRCNLDLVTLVTTQLHSFYKLKPRKNGVLHIAYNQCKMALSPALSKPNIVELYSNNVLDLRYYLVIT